MSNLIRWDPLREMMTWRSFMDRVFDNTFDQPDAFSQGNWGMALDVAENDDAFIVKASLPGVNPEDLNITYANNVLTIQGEVKDEKDVDENRYHLRERRYGSFSRSVSLPSNVKGDDIDARYESGVLTLQLPKTEEAKPKRIAIKSAGAPQMIEGRSREIRSKN